MDRLPSFPLVPIGWITGFLIAGLLWWTIPYNGDVSSTILLACAGANGIIAGLLVMLGAGRARRIGPLMTLTIPAAIMVRVSIDYQADPTSHNLWPFELVFGAGLAAIGILPAIVVGRILRHSLGRGPRSNG